MSEVKYTTGAKILKGFAYILMGAAIILIMFGFSGLFMGTGIPGLDPLWMLGIGFLLFMASVPLLVVAQSGIIKPEFDTITLMRCTNLECKFTKGKKFEKDEYVFKELEEKCDKCDSNFYIAAIFEVEKKPKEEKKEKEKPPEESKDQKESWTIVDEKTKNQ